MMNDRSLEQILKPKKKEAGTEQGGQRAEMVV